MNEEVQYVHHNIKDAVFNLVCLAYPYVKMKGLVDNLHKDCKDQIEVYEREHKALEIIKNKKVNVTRLMVAESVEYYNKLYNDRFSLTQDEFDLLKEVLK